jgi:hypothetical protein
MPWTKNGWRTTTPPVIPACERPPARVIPFRRPETKEERNEE